MCIILIIYYQLDIILNGDGTRFYPNTLRRIHYTYSILWSALFTTASVVVLLLLLLLLFIALIKLFDMYTWYMRVRLTYLTKNERKSLT